MNTNTKITAAGALVVGQEKAKDPVCVMSVETATAKYTLNHGGQIQHFCGRGCLMAFERNSQMYVDPGYRPSMTGVFLDWAHAH